MQTDYVKLVVRRMYDAQKLRIQTDQRMDRLIRDKIVLKETAEKDFEKALELEKEIENEYERIIWREIKDFPIVRDWLIKVKGVGPRISGLLVANLLPISRFPTVAKMWAYCGLHVIDGRAARRKVGEKANWSQELKITAWKAGKSFIKLKKGGPYADIYRSYKEYLINREVVKNGNVIWTKKLKDTKWYAVHIPEGMETPEKIKEKPEWTLGRIDNMALRRSVKLFLAHLWQVWRVMEGLPIREPYAIEYLGHTTAIDPWDMIEEE
jgi:hypothetical protein